MHLSSAILFAPLACLVAGQGHLAVIGEDGVSVGYKVGSPEIAVPLDDSGKNLVGTSSVAAGLPLQSQPIKAHTPIVPAIPTGQTSGPVTVMVSTPQEEPGNVRPVSQPATRPTHVNVQPSSIGTPIGHSIGSKPPGAEPGKDPSRSHGIWFLNRNAITQHLSADWAEKDYARYGKHPVLDFQTLELNPGEDYFVRALPHLSPKIFVGVSPNNKTSRVGSHRDHDTVVEATFDSSYDLTYYDIDVEKGFSSPVWCHAQGEPWEKGQGCTTDVLAVCPEKDQHIHEDTGLYDQCRGLAQNPAFGRHHCPHTYVQWNDDWNTKGMSKGNHVLVCTIMPTPATSKLQLSQIDEAARKAEDGLHPTAVLPRRALPRSHRKHKQHSGHVQMLLELGSAAELC
ncbi:hypothetical protein AUEXF2481DRAFT_38529 [Aureobasidium subglaciale EXF-2481]|uniref:Uncharacterized protein n=1 Tax=Aureobasidium subglaciale (strain EXF-2481) TaxID=1043005 RepID=A0A074YM75_AURSE|nr:uncharacterized protein AUEXF2481DRAFT_38529 [Aureobasidium subglaciale EXF-2481]KAI5201495.1 hypothetical protein E4T38_06013 [Aureobasidium subglaciale]KAI5220089.1 hypothetical protein E4T40_06034 [Aureobasidium subglaciale]KAI5224014.1 hypothetical protein E4T41_05874 [Aureobasidium subglaciale]KAI5260688.1 hypothetical protein E4T46_05768 [Aureobasidium subglaciale]KEQ97124.1 hypothetical protein AUEXF2481DRAFT_38529 [Aureobasidium subglaciale EXF-2481]